MAKTRKKVTQKMKEASVTEDVLPVSFDSPESSNILRATYDPGQQELRITFKSRKEDKTPTYAYAEVSVALWVEFFHAPSKGTFFFSAIKPMFNGRRL